MHALFLYISPAFFFLSFVQCIGLQNRPVDWMMMHACYSNPTSDMYVIFL